MQIFSDINKQLIKNIGTEEGIATILAAYVAIASTATRTDAEPILHAMCDVISLPTQQTPHARALAIQAASRIALSVHMGSPRALFVYHLPVLLAAWFSSVPPKTLKDFPFHILECDSLVQFLKE